MVEYKIKLQNELVLTIYRFVKNYSFEKTKIAKHILISFQFQNMPSIIKYVPLQKQNKYNTYDKKCTKGISPDHLYTVSTC